MCGRYSVLDDVDELCERFICPLPGFTLRPRYNAAPAQTLPVVTGSPAGRKLRQMRWGLVPFWAEDARMGSRLINARQETLAEKPAFKGALRQRRCLVPADGYYEWLSGEQGKVPYRVTAETGGVFAFAGLWVSWAGPEGTLDSFTIVTAEPAPAIAWLHNRMPLILARDMEEVWLKGPHDFSPAGMSAFLSQLRPVDTLKAYRVSTRVNSPKNDDSSVLESIGSQ